MTDLLAVLRLLLEICAEGFRLYRRHLFQPLLTAGFLTVCYATIHIGREGSVMDGLRSAFLDNETARSLRLRTEAQSQLQAELHQFAVANKLIDQDLQMLLAHTNASRIRLNVIHNGVMGLTGAGLLRYDVTNTVAAPGRSAGGQVENQPLSDWSDFLPALLTGQCVMLHVTDLHATTLRARFESFGAATVMICPAADIEGKAVGATFTFWDSGDQAPKGDELARLMQEGVHIGSQIAAVLDLREPQAWPPSPGDHN